MSRKFRLLALAAIAAMTLSTAACADLTAPRGTCSQGNSSDCPGGGG